MAFISTSRPSGSNIRYDTHELRAKLEEAFPEMRFKEEEVFAAQQRRISGLPDDKQPAPIVAETLKRNAAEWGPGYVFKMTLEGGLVFGTVRRIDVTFLFAFAPSDAVWKRVYDFAVSLHLGEVHASRERTVSAEGWDLDF